MATPSYAAESDLLLMIRTSVLDQLKGSNRSVTTVDIFSFLLTYFCEPSDDYNSGDGLDLLSAATFEEVLREDLMPELRNVMLEPEEDAVTLRQAFTRATDGAVCATAFAAACAWNMEPGMRECVAVIRGAVAELCSAPQAYLPRFQRVLEGLRERDKGGSGGYLLSVGEVCSTLQALGLPGKIHLPGVPQSSRTVDAGELHRHLRTSLVRSYLLSASYFATFLEGLTADIFIRIEPQAVNIAAREASTPTALGKKVLSKLGLLSKFKSSGGKGFQTASPPTVFNPSPTSLSSGKGASTTQQRASSPLSVTFSGAGINANVTSPKGGSPQGASKASGGEGGGEFTLCSPPTLFCGGLVEGGSSSSTTTTTNSIVAEFLYAQSAGGGGGGGGGSITSPVPSTVEPYQLRFTPLVLNGISATWIGAYYSVACPPNTLKQQGGFDSILLLSAPPTPSQRLTLARRGYVGVECEQQQQVGEGSAVASSASTSTSATSFLFYRPIRTSALKAHAGTRDPLTVISSLAVSVCANDRLATGSLRPPTPSIEEIPLPHALVKLGVPSSLPATLSRHIPPPIPHVLTPKEDGVAPPLARGRWVPCGVWEGGERSSCCLWAYQVAIVCSGAWVEEPASTPLVEEGDSYVSGESDDSVDEEEEEEDSSDEEDYDSEEEEGDSTGDFDSEEGKGEAKKEGIVASGGGGEMTPAAHGKKTKGKKGGKSDEEGWVMPKSFQRQLLALISKALGKEESGGGGRKKGSLKEGGLTRQEKSTSPLLLPPSSLPTPPPATSTSSLSPPSSSSSSSSPSLPPKPSFILPPHASRDHPAGVVVLDVLSVGDARGPLATALRAALKKDGVVEELRVKSWVTQGETGASATHRVVSSTPGVATGVGSMWLWGGVEKCTVGGGESGWGELKQSGTVGTAMFRGVRCRGCVCVLPLRLDAEAAQVLANPPQVEGGGGLLPPPLPFHHLNLSVHYGEVLIGTLKLPLFDVLAGRLASARTLSVHSPAAAAGGTPTTVGNSRVCVNWVKFKGEDEGDWVALEGLEEQEWIDVASAPAPPLVASSGGGVGMGEGEKVVSYKLPPLPPSRPSTRVSRTLRGLSNGPFRGRQYPTPTAGLVIQGQGVVAVSATSRFPVWHPESQPPFSLFSRGVALHDPANAPILCPPTISKHRGELIDRLKGMYREAQRQQGEAHLSLWAAAEEGDPVSTGLIPASVLPRTLARTGVVVDGVVCGEVMDLLLFGSGEVLCEREIAQGSLQYTPIIPQFLDDGQGVFVDWLLLCDLVCPPPALGEGGREEGEEGMEDGEVAALVASQMRHRLRLRIAHWKRKESMATFTPPPPLAMGGLVGGGEEEVSLIPPTVLPNIDDAHLPCPLLAAVTLQEISALVSRVGASHPAGEVSTSAFPGHTALGAAMAHSRGGGMGEWGASKAVLLPLLSLGDALEDEAACLIATRDLACFSRRRGVLGGNGVGLELNSPQAAQLRVNVREFSLCLVSPASHPQLPTPIPSSTTTSSSSSSGEAVSSTLPNPGDLAPPFSPLDAAYTLSLSRYGGFDEEEVALSNALRSCPHFEGHMDVVAPFLLALSGGVKGGVSASTITSPFSRTLIRETLENALGITTPLSTTALYKMALRCPPPQGAVGAPMPLPPPGYPGDEESPPPYIHLPLFIRTYLDLSPSEFTAHAKTLENAARVEQTLDSTLVKEGVRGRGEEGVRVPWGARVEKAISIALDLSHTTQALASVNITIPPRAAFSRHIMGAIFSLSCPLSHSNALLVARRYALSTGGCTPGLGFLVHADCVADLLKGKGRWGSGGGGEGGLESGRAAAHNGPSASGGGGRDAGSGMIDPHAASFISSLAPPGASIRIITTPSKGKGTVLQGGGEEAAAAAAVVPPPHTSSHPFLPTPVKTKSRTNASTPPPQWSFPYAPSSSSASTVTQPPTMRSDVAPASYPPTPPLPAPPVNPSNAAPVAALSIKGIPSATLESRLREFQATGRWSCTVCYYESNPPFSSACGMCTKPNALLEMVSEGEDSSSLRTALGPLKASKATGVVVTGSIRPPKTAGKANVCEVCAWDNKKAYTLCAMCASPSVEEEARNKSVSPLNPPSPVKQQQSAMSVVAPLPPPSPSSSFSSSPTPPTATVSHLLQPAVTLFTDPWRTRHTNTTILHDSTLKAVTPAVLAELGLGRGGGGGYHGGQQQSSLQPTAAASTVPSIPVSEGPFKPGGFATNGLEDSINTGLLISGVEDNYAFNISPAGKGAIGRQWSLGGKNSLPSLFNSSGF